jgi:hypothetical protein
MITDGSKTGAKINSEIERKRAFLRAVRRVQHELFMTISQNELKDVAYNRLYIWEETIKKKLCIKYKVTTKVPFTNLSGILDQALRELSNSVFSMIDDIDVEVRINDVILHEDNYIELGDDWKSRARSYVTHIREIVANAEIVEVSVREYLVN